MRRLTALAGFALIALVSAPASAQDTTPPPPPAASAQAPLAVQSVPGGGERMTATPEMKAARQAMRASCASDMASLCADTPAAQPGERAGRMQCMRAHAAQLSVACRQALVTLRDARKSAKS